MAACRGHFTNRRAFIAEIDYASIVAATLKPGKNFPIIDGVMQRLFSNNNLRHRRSAIHGEASRRNRDIIKQRPSFDAKHHKRQAVCCSADAALWHHDGKTSSSCLPCAGATSSKRLKCQKYLITSRRYSLAAHRRSTLYVARTRQESGGQQ